MASRTAGEVTDGETVCSELYKYVRQKSSKLI